VGGCRLAVGIERPTVLIGLSLGMIALLLAAGVMLDLIFGEVRRWHPLVGFGRMANSIESELNRGAHKYLTGALAWMVAAIPLVLLAVWLIHIGNGMHFAIGAAFHAILLYFSLGFRSLRDHAKPIEQALQQNDLPAARKHTARIVSRDTQQANESDLAKAGVESLLENGNDAVFGTLFWFAVAGGPGALLFRLANTLDAMWGYRNSRFLKFGWAAARIDDVLNWIPARLTSLSYALLGNTKQAWHCWRTQAPQWSSPNAGPVLASGAGALGVRLGGAACYNGVIENRPLLGAGGEATAADIGRAWRLVVGTTLMWISVAAIAAAISWVLERNMHA
jgi:adenosylcobinamide-phosphate synthase